MTVCVDSAHDTENVVCDEDAHRIVFERIFGEFARGKLVRPRGELVLELEDFSYVLPPYVRFQSFEPRRLNVSYIKHEMLWYLRGDKHDTSICDKAKMWGGLVNADGTINSNYGQYVFGEQNQFDNVVKTLVADKDSRRASIVILNHGHLIADTKDVPCTYSMNFRIRENALNMSVHMRSQDAIYGMGNDAPAFSIIHEMMLRKLQAYYPELRYGMYHHAVDSFHVYERHFVMLKAITSGCDYTLVQCPQIACAAEVDFLRRLDDEHASVPDDFKFTRWLVS